MARKGKGSVKRRKSQYTYGHKNRSGSTRAPPENKKKKPVLRFNEEIYEEHIYCDSEGQITTRGYDGKPIEAIILRPRKQKDFYQEYNEKTTGAGDDNTYAFLHRGKTLDMFNKAFSAHREESPDCIAPLAWYHAQIQQRGLCWILGLKCTKCSFVTKKGTILYNEIPTKGPGRKPAAPNIALQIGLARHGIGITGLADILNSINCIAPSLSGMQRTANKVSKFLVAQNVVDMGDIVLKLKEINVMKGLPPVIQLMADGMFNNSLSSGFGRTPFQPGSRCYYTMAEMLSRAKKIVHARVHQRLCACRGRVHGPGCTATMAHNATIGNEGSYLEEGVEQIRKLGVDVWALTLDGDSNANNVARRLVTKVFTCARHLSRRTCSNIKNNVFTEKCFPGYKKEERAKYQTRFALDFSHRMQAEMRALARKYPGNLDRVLEVAKNLDNALILCYQGDHSECHAFSLVCQPNRPWRRPYLPRTAGGRNPDTLVIDPEPTDVLKLKVAMGMRFSVGAVEQTYLNNDQNKCEATNRAIVKSLPKHIEWFRNAPGRLHARIHALNNLPGRSLIQLCASAGAEISPKSKVTHQLARRDHKVRSDRIRQKGPKYIKARAEARMTRFDDHEDKNPDDCYKTGAFLWGPAKAERLADYRITAAQRLRTTRSRVNSEHCYSARPTRQRKPRKL